MSADFAPQGKYRDPRICSRAWLATCKGRLSLHQPDPDVPGRLLATCNDCKSWYLVNDGGDEMVCIAPASDHASGW